MEERFSAVLKGQNAELVQAINTHQKALDQIMGKYREQMKLLKRINELEKHHRENHVVDDCLEKRRLYLSNTCQDFPALISQGCDKDLILIERQRIFIDKIRKENDNMRKSLATIEETP